MLPDLVSNPGPLIYESGALPIALRGPAEILLKRTSNRKSSIHPSIHLPYPLLKLCRIPFLFTLSFMTSVRRQFDVSCLLGIVFLSLIAIQSFILSRCLLSFISVKSILNLSLILSS